MSGKNILLIEDDDLDVISIERSLKKLEGEHRLHTAYNGIEALQILKGEAEEKLETLPDVILLDINMPKMNGVEFLREMRKDDKFKNIKVYVMTTSNEDRDRARMEILGVSGYFIKPLNFNDNTKRSSSMDNFMHFQLLKIIGQ